MTVPIGVEHLMADGTTGTFRIEYATEWDPESILHTICAFANDLDAYGGGCIDGMIACGTVSLLYPDKPRSPKQRICLPNRS